MPNVVLLFKRSLLFLFLLIFFSVHFASTVHAQTPPPAQTTTSNEFPAINADPSVPRNLHTITQSLLIEVMAAVTCQIGGIDPINPTSPCLGINPETHQLAYPPSSPQTTSEVKVGGVVGAAINMVAVMYVPPTSSIEYFHDVASNFGLVKTANAAQKNGFEGLRPVLGLWTVSRNVAYFLLIIAFVFIGIGVMLRIKIDPRTVMTIQNQIPRVIISIILITFSYAISALMIDGMWALTYAGVNLISNAANTSIPCKSAGSPRTVSSQATQGILQTPIAYLNSVFASQCVEDGGNAGIFLLTNSVATIIGDVVQSSVNSLLNSSLKSGDCSITSGSGIKACFESGLSVFLEWLVRIAMTLVVFVAVIIALFRVWWSLLKAYVQLLIYVFIAPVYIVFGLAPGRPLGFERWIRGYFANLIAFPLTAYLFVAARVASDLYKNSPQDQFVPPLVGNPVSGNFGALIAFGFIMLAPTIVDLMKEKLKAPATKQAGQLSAGVMGAAALAAAVPKKTWQHLNKRNPQTGQPMGVLANVREQLGTKALRAIPGVGGKWAAQKEYMSQTGRRANKEQLDSMDTRSSGQVRKDNKALAPLHSQYNEAKNPSDKNKAPATPEQLHAMRERLAESIKDPRRREQFKKEVADDARAYQAHQQRLAEQSEAFKNAFPQANQTAQATEGANPTAGQPTPRTAETGGTPPTGEQPTTPPTAGAQTPPTQKNNITVTVEGLGTHNVSDQRLDGSGSEYLQLIRRPGTPEFDIQDTDLTGNSLRSILANDELKTKFTDFMNANKDSLEPSLFQPPDANGVS